MHEQIKFSRGNGYGAALDSPDLRLLCCVGTGLAARALIRDEQTKLTATAHGTLATGRLKEPRAAAR